MRRGLVAVLCVPALAACGEGAEPEAVEEPTVTALEAAYDECAGPTFASLVNSWPDGNVDSLPRRFERGFRLEDDGRSLLVSRSRDAYIASALVDATRCVLSALDAPSPVEQKLKSTTPMMGMLSESWGDVRFDWSVSVDRYVPTVSASFQLVEG